MDWTLYAAFVLASAVLIVMPGPNVTLIIAESLSHGRRAGVAVVAGAIGAQALQLLLVVAGLAALVAAYGSAFTVVRWLGAAYLIWMGVMMLRAAGRAGRAAPPSRASSIRRGALVALANPKTLVFHAAFLPQFVDPAAAAAP
ncbi:MAG: LysE family translocator, partial [Caulobacterales bacterium]|nr:LysE family translocator [Caulobacterales bacterium]